MDSFKDYKSHSEGKTYRHHQELASMTPRREEDKLPYKPHIKRSVGEYYPTKEDRVKVNFIIIFS